jgi:transmembrane sensor
MDSSTRTVEQDPIMTQATEWLLELQDREATEARIKAWQHWLAADPRHLQAFDRLQNLQEHIDEIPALPWPTEDEIAADPYDGSISVTAWGRCYTAAKVHRSPPSSMWPVAAGLATALVAAICVVGYRLFDLQPSGASAVRVVETGVGELRRMRLSDGSTVTVDGRTRLTFEMKAHVREVILEQGEAFFEVAKDPHRPFVVQAAEASITAVGTAFDVRQVGTRLTVAVAEGVVQIQRLAEATPSTAGSSGRQFGKATRLTAGHRVQLDAGGAATPSPLAPDAVAAWRDGRRQYLAEPLADVAADLGRYSAHRIIIKDAAVGQLSVTGTVFERDIDHWLKSLETALPVEVTENSDGSVEVSARP